MGNEVTKNLQATEELSDDQIGLLIANTNFNRFSILGWYEDFMTENPSGKLTQKQFEKSFKQLYTTGNAEEYAQLVFNTFDVDKNGYISFHEYLLAISALSNGDLNYRLHLLFKVYDLNSNGVIDATELEKVLDSLFSLKGVAKENQIGEKSAKDRVKFIFQKFDKDHNQELSEDEFVTGCLEDPYIMAILLPSDN